VSVCECVRAVFCLLHFDDGIIRTHARMATENVLPAFEIAAENPGKNRAFHFGKSARDAYDPKIHKPYAVNRITTSKYTVRVTKPRALYILCVYFSLRHTRRTIVTTIR